MKISSIASITSCVNAIPLHIFCHTNLLPVDAYLLHVEDTTVEDATVDDATVEDTTSTTNTPAYYEFTTRTLDFDHSTESGWSTSIPAHQNLYGVDAPPPSYRPNEKTLKQRAAKAKAQEEANAQEETFTTESNSFTESTESNSFTVHSQCNIL